MSLPHIKELLYLNNLSQTDIEEEIIKIKKQLFNLRLQQANRQSVKPHAFKHAQHKLGQLLMLNQLYVKPNQTYINCLKTRMNCLLPKEKTNLNLKLKIIKE